MVAIVRRRSIFARAALVLLAVLVPACGGGNGEEPRGATPIKGGTFRAETDSFEWTSNFDPTGEYLSSFFGIYSNLLGRTLMGYKHVAGPEGNELIPDLAQSEPVISDDGLTYTFTIRPGVRFSPPISREVTSRDVEFAFKRIGTESLVAQYGFYYDVIEGMREFKEAGGLTKSGNEISGIQTPDDHTITFKLTEVTGDFPYRLAMPATGPIPEEVAKCFTKAGEYGRFVISSGPYMVEGSEKLDTSGCKTMKPISGFHPNERVIMVRNPNYDEATDTTEARENFVDRIEITHNTNTKDIFARTKVGQLDYAYASVPPEVVREYTTDDELRDRLKINPSDATWYITMNLTQPPFDDVHVRIAANYIMDKEGLRRAAGGSSAGEIAGHIVPDTMFGNELKDYDPYATENDAGDLETAKEHMAQSKYDTDNDGICDAPECKNVLHVNRTTDLWVAMEPVVEESLGRIGIELVSRQFEDAYTVTQTVNRQVPISSVAGWGKDYADPSTFMVLFDSRSIIPQGNINYSLVGLTPELANEVGAKGTVEGIPSVDADIDHCNELTGDERQTCWEDLDKKLMEEVVPWIPYRFDNRRDVIGPAVTKYVYDQFSGEIAWAHVAVDATQQE